MKKRKRTPRGREPAKRRQAPEHVDQPATSPGTPQLVSDQSDEAAAQAPFALATQPPRHAALLKKIELGLAIALTLFAIWLHVTRMTHAGGLWRDEAGAAALALMPSIRELAQSFQHEAFPLLFPLTVRGYAAVAGSSDMDFRIFGLLVGLSLLAALWLNARLAGREVPLLSLALLGSNALVIVWGDSIRGYGLAMVLIIITMSLIWRVATQCSVWSAAGALLAAICSVQVLFANSVSLFVIGLAGAAVALRSRHWMRALLIMAIGGVAALTLLPYRESLQDASGWRETFRLPEYTFSRFATKLTEAMATVGPGILWAWIFLLVAGVIVAAWSQFRRPSAEGNRSRDLGLYALVILLLGGPAHFAFLKVLSYPTQQWYFLGLLALIAAGMEAAFLAFPLRWWRSMVRLLLALAFTAWSFAPGWGAAQYRQTNIDLMAEKIEQTGAADDFVVVMPWYLGVSFGR